MERHERPRDRDQRDVVETIVTCACSHELAQHTKDGCVVTDCFCKVERRDSLLGKVRAIDELQ